MSTDIQPGQIWKDRQGPALAVNPFTKGAKVRAVRDTKSYGVGTPIPKGTVLEVARTNVVVAGQLFNAIRPDGGEYALAKADFETADTTPAPLDPSADEALAVVRRELGIEGAMSRPEPPTLHLPDLSSMTTRWVSFEWETALDSDGDIILRLVKVMDSVRPGTLSSTTHATVEDAEHAAIRIWRNYRAVSRRNSD